MALLSGVVLVAMGANGDNGCAPDEPAAAARVECRSARDCTGTPDVDCVGAWECNANQCEFECGGTPIEPACAADSDCATGETCRDGRCVGGEVEACAADSDCAAGEVCKDGRCVEGEVVEPTGCTHSGECPVGEYCTADDCTNNCADGANCFAPCVGECKPREDGSICHVDSDCRAGERCDTDPCVFPDSDAGADERMPCGGVCTPVETCGDHGACAPGEICTCGPASAGDAPENGVMCFLQCMPANPVCAADSDCAAGQVCQNGACVEAQRECYDDTECPDTFHCESSCAATDSNGDGVPEGDRALPYCPSYCVPDGGTCADTGVECAAGETCVSACAWVCPDCICPEGESCEPCECYEQCESACVPDQGTCVEELCPEGTSCGCPDPNMPVPFNALILPQCDLKCIPDVRECWSDTECAANQVCVPSDCGGAPLPCDPGFESCDADRPAPPACPGTCQDRVDPGYDCKSDENCVAPDGQQGFCKIQECVTTPADARPCNPDDSSCGAMPPAPEEVCYGYCVYDGPVHCDPNVDTCPEGTHCEEVGGCAGSSGGSEPSFVPCFIDYQCVPNERACASDCDCPADLACIDGACQVANRINECVIDDGCTNDSECGEGQICKIDPNQPVCACVGCPCSIPRGTCEPAPNDGSCDTDADCLADETCNFYFPPCAPPPPDDPSFVPSCEPIGVCEPRPVDPDGCFRTGCSGQLCADTDMASTCEWRDEYACYDYAICARGPDGACGWQKTERYVQCVEGLPQPE